MNALPLAACAALVILAGCAPVHYTKADIDGRVVCNADAMDQVERDARRKFAQVHWVHCPRATLRVI
ncbi:MAG: hypothetical protein KJ018_19120 [Burkholderiales bacterium]|nr:hypothetical protein [Burkholderiales bacterium]GIK85633.1 MAG: hypothetical protein BroJett026_11140 [Betaproteobacteria bacterium]